ncbi:MAG: indole-3-glycerol phosphate synthase TrpC [Pyrinomonadaceae bacterium]
MDILTRIIQAKKKCIETAKYRVPLDTLRAATMTTRASLKRHALIGALNNDRINVIAEFKRKSPSKGTIRDDVAVDTMARHYQAGGAGAISVLTEEDYFDGSLEDLTIARTVVSLPVLRKDFIVDEYQVYESAAAGADALLLIVAALDDAHLIELRQLAEDELGMDALVEVHTSTEMQRAVASGAKLIGVNNRNLKTFEVTLDTSISLSRQAPGELVLVSESGLNTNEDLTRLHSMGYRGFLIGESLMRAERPDETLRMLIGEEKADGEKG